MNAVPPGAARRTGIAAVSAGLLLFLSTATELVHQVQRPDGTVTEPVLFAVLLSAWTLGTAALMVAIAGISAATDPPDERRRVAGRRTSLVGAGLLCAFGLAVLVAGLVSGQPVEASFLLFALGLLLTAVGHTMLALAVRRTGALGRWWLALLVAAARRPGRRPGVQRPLARPRAVHLRRRVVRARRPAADRPPTGGGRPGPASRPAAAVGRLVAVTAARR